MRRASAVFCYFGQMVFGPGTIVMTLAVAPSPPGCPIPRLDVLKALASVAVEWWLLSGAVVSCFVVLRLLFGRDTIESDQAAMRLGALLLAIDVVAAGWSLFPFDNKLLRIDLPVVLIFFVLHSMSFWVLYGLRPLSLNEAAAPKY